MKPRCHNNVNRTKVEDSLGGLNGKNKYLNNFKTLPSSSFSLLPAFKTHANLNVGYLMKKEESEKLQDECKEEMKGSQHEKRKMD
jgi:hypothetical protein